jgi:hypothetical protein
MLAVRDGISSVPVAMNFSREIALPEIIPPEVDFPVWRRKPGDRH